MKLINGIATFIAIGGSTLLILGCDDGGKALELNVHSLYLGYEVDFKYFNENLPQITPVEFDCYFRAVNNSHKPLQMNFAYNNDDALESFLNLDGDLFYTMFSDKSTIALRPLQKAVLIPSESQKIISTKFPYKESDKMKDLVKGTSMDQIALQLNDLNFFFRNSELDSVKVQNEELHIYFMFSDTSITCTSKGCSPYIDPAIRE